MGGASNTHQNNWIIGYWRVLYNTSDCWLSLREYRPIQDQRWKQQQKINLGRWKQGRALYHFETLLGAESKLNKENEEITIVIEGLHRPTGPFSICELERAKSKIVEGKAAGPLNRLDRLDRLKSLSDLIWMISYWTLPIASWSEETNQTNGQGAISSLSYINLPTVLYWIKSNQF